MSNKYLEKLEIELKLKGSSQKTIDTYSFFISKFLLTLEKTPEKTTEDDVKKFLATLIDSYSNTSCALTISSLKYFFKKIVKLNVMAEIETPKKEEHIPAVLTKQEVKKLIDACLTKTSRLIVSLLYSSGLRVSELTNLKKENIDLENNKGFIRKGKGKKDRQIFLSKQLCQDLKKYFETVDNLIFPGQDNKTMSSRNIQLLIQRAAKRAEIDKRVTPHTLRHSYATHLLEKGVDIRKIQVLLGHSRIDTTQIYTKVSTKELEKIENPLDEL